MKQVLILGAYGQNNIGDEALLQVFASQFKDYKVIVNSARPELTAERYNLKTIPTHLTWPPFAGLSAIIRSDIMVFGGGSLLKEIEGSAFTRTFYCIRIIILLLIARLLGHRTLMLGVGMGPLHGKLYCTLSRIAANMTDLICVRDADSAKLLRDIGVRRQIHITADPVFLLEQLLKPETELPSLKFSEAPVVAVMPRYSLTPAQLGKLAEACDHMVEKYGAYIWIIPFQTGYLPRYDDLTTSNSLKSLMKHPECAEIKVLETPAEVMEALGQTDLVLSTRLHALIFATIKAVPCIALSYEVKVAGFMAEVGLQDNTLTLADLEEGKLNTTLDTVWQRREAITESLKGKATQLEVAAARNFELAHNQLEAKTSGGLLRSGALLFISITIVNAGNYLFNLVLGRWLGPSAFAELSLIVTLTLVITFISSTLQTVAAKFSAMYTVDNDLEQLSGLRKWLQRIAMGFGFGLMLVTIVAAPFLKEFFHTSSPWPFILLALAFPFCFAQGVDRGILQGKTRFGLLALSYQAEMWVRLGGAVVLVAAGFSVSGAVGAILLSFIATWYIARKVRKQLPHNGHFQPKERSKAMHFAVPVSVALIGQVLLNNSDIIIVNHFFEQHAAGQYAAVALIGRIVFFATWSVVTTLFPVVAQLERQGKSHRHLLGYSLGLVGVISSIILVATLLQPELIMRILFGEAYLESAPLLWLYALATAFYSMANVIITYRLSAGNGGGSVFAIVAGVSQVLGLCFWHDSLQQVVLIQVFIMAGLFVLLLAWDTWLTFRRVLVRNAI